MSAPTTGPTTPLRRLRNWPLTSLTAAFGAAGLCAFVAFSGAPEDAPASTSAADEAPKTKIVEVHDGEAPTPVDDSIELDRRVMDEDVRADAPEAEPVEEEFAPPPGERKAEAKAKKSGLYAMKGPARPASSARPSAPPSDGFGEMSGDAIGGAYGVAGLGVTGTGKGGGGEGYGRGLGAGFGSRHKGEEGRMGREMTETWEDGGEYDKNVQARQLSAGVTNDGADPEGYAKALSEMSHLMNQVDVPASMWHLDAPSQRHDAHPEALDVALVIDTTGSMGDELEYLKVELREIAEEINGQFPNVEQRWSMVAYRDHGDAYVTRVADFDDVDDFVATLGGQSAGGGGDMPEAMDAALADALQLSWQRSDDTAKMVFLVGDAPPHSGAGESELAKAVHGLRDANVAIYPVAASGVNDRAELLMRMAAKVTGGQYIFLTDHSGIGNPHAKPHVDQYEVETLHQVMHRMIVEELSAQGPNVPTIATGPVAEGGAPVVQGPCVHQGFWGSLFDRLGNHFEFALGFGLTMLAAIGLDVTLRRRRRES